MQNGKRRAKKSRSLRSGFDINAKIDYRGVVPLLELPLDPDAPGVLVDEDDEPGVWLVLDPGCVDELELLPELRSFVDWVSGSTLASRGMVLRMALRMGAHHALDPCNGNAVARRCLGDIGAPAIDRLGFGGRSREQRERGERDLHRRHISRALPTISPASLTPK